MMSKGHKGLAFHLTWQRSQAARHFFDRWCTRRSSSCPVGDFLWATELFGCCLWGCWGGLSPARTGSPSLASGWTVLCRLSTTGEGGKTMSVQQDIRANAGRSTRPTFFLVRISISSWESGKHVENRWGFCGALFSAVTTQPNKLQVQNRSRMKHQTLTQHHHLLDPGGSTSSCQSSGAQRLEGMLVYYPLVEDHWRDSVCALEKEGKQRVKTVYSLHWRQSKLPSMCLPTWSGFSWSCSVGTISGWTFSLCTRWFELLVVSGTVDHLGLAVGFDAVNDCKQSLQGQKVGGVQLPRHWKSIL